MTRITCNCIALNHQGSWRAGFWGVTEVWQCDDDGGGGGSGGGGGGGGVGGGSDGGGPKALHSHIQRRN